MFRRLTLCLTRALGTGLVAGQAGATESIYPACRRSLTEASLQSNVIEKIID